MVTKLQLIPLMLFVTLLTSCGLGFQTSEEVGLRYPTKPITAIPKNIQWEDIHFAKEILNATDKIVYLGRGSNPIPKKEWEDFSVLFPWVKNMNRNLLFTKTALLRSPSAPWDCQGTNCFIETTHKGYSWVELARLIAVDYIPAKTDTRKPAEGHLAVKVTKKCQTLVWENEIYELSDNKGNKYVMHATETGIPSLDVVLPAGFKLQKVKIDEPLVIVPFGEKRDCYFNIVGDHLGQGYHQYKYATAYYPEK